MLTVAPDDDCPLTLVVNGERWSGRVSARLTLADLLRDVLRLTGTHVGCEHGVCGCCTVHVDGQPARACLLLAVQLEGSEVCTVESLVADDGSLHPLQEAFHEHHALQCGFCTPGQLMNALAFYEDAPAMSDEQIRHRLTGQLCRCTGYGTIVDAIRDAASRDAAQAGSAR